MKIKTARGVQDTPPEEKIIKNKVVDTLREVFELYGFAPLETPIIERYETLAAKFAAGEESDALKETFQLTDQGKRKLALRFDLTVPLARFIAMNPMLKMPFKRYELGIVFRDGPIKAGRTRQFWQCDVDIIGSKSMLADAEIIAILDAAFKKLNLDTIIPINNRKLLNGILDQCKVKNKNEAIISLDKLEKIGQTGVETELRDKKLNQKQIDQIFEFIKTNITLEELKTKITNEEAKEGIEELEELFSYLKSMNVNSTKFDISLARGLAYYTGTVFEVFAKKSKITSSLAGGGRWDDMIGKFKNSTQPVPAVGVAFGIVPIMEAIKEKEDLEQKTPAKVYVIPIKTITESLKIVQELRNNEINTTFDLNNKGMSKNLNYANAQKIPYVIIVGENEVKEKKVMFRDMKTGNQELLTVKEVIKKLK